MLKIAFSLKERISYCGFLWSSKPPKTSELHSCFPHYCCIFMCFHLRRCWDMQKRKAHWLSGRKSLNLSIPKLLSIVIFAQVIELAMSCFLYSLEPFGVWKSMQAFIFEFWDKTYFQLKKLITPELRRCGIWSTSII